MTRVPGVVSDRAVGEDEVQSITGLAPRTVRELEARGEFPRARKVSLRRKAWLLSELVEWLHSRPVTPLPEPRTNERSDDDDGPAHAGAPERTAALR
jgi:predicted DNA-binding transcriptional regulator AlpA